MKFVELFLTPLHKSILCMGKLTKYHRNIAPLKRLFSPVYSSPDKLLNGKMCTDPPFVYTGLEEESKFLNGKQFCNV